MTNDVTATIAEIVFTSAPLHKSLSEQKQTDCFVPSTVVSVQVLEPTLMAQDLVTKIKFRYAMYT